MSKIFGVILCGGKGERFWPKSRRRCPKQFIRLFERRSLIQATSDRIRKLCPIERQLFVAPEEFAGLIRQELGVKKENLILEPFGRNTAPAIGLAAATLYRDYPEAVMVVLPADHLIEPESEFHRAVRLAIKVAETGLLVTFGIIPTRPDTGYGYIEQGAVLLSKNGQTVYRVKTFREKPDKVTAQRYLRSGRFLWNSGMFVWRVDTIMNAFARFMPDFHKMLTLLSQNGSRKARVFIRKIYDQVQSVSIDYAIMEKAENAAVVRAGFNWDDVGSWLALERRLPLDKEGNTTSGLWFGINTRNCVIYTDEGVVGTLGIKNLVIARSGDALLVSTKKALGNLKQLLAKIQEHPQGARYL
ncbi:MAG: mannose-1-phosphate guanylyltransferase [candidate division WOR-3 bacterium]